MGHISKEKAAVTEMRLRGRSNISDTGIEKRMDFGDVEKAIAGFGKVLDRRKRGIKDKAMIASLGDREKRKDVAGKGQEFTLYLVVL